MVLITLMFFAGFLEMIGISLILPLLSLLTGTLDSQSNFLNYLDSFYKLIDLERDQLIIRKVYEAKVQNKESCEIWGDGTGRREFMYAEDLVDFILFSLENYNKIPQYCNVGIGHDYTINEYHSVVAEVIDYKGNFSHDLTKPSGVDRRLLDISSQKSLGWKPSHTLEEGIEKTFEYFKKII